ncbi:type 4a pilus biogenesis protein PilO [Denitratisoma oestradiolicum]|uniref:Pilus assembly protein PilO n=1 Tax=Denitratisoma oestradiolicum TaxID=311182 RepID=A0A6S6Y008_9PROT|nr:type 4a pilus biogenesis protein PilO [Denitratisoma oestradiolicum]TWO80025.1 pilus assembly protein PilO [Denitratisoma oestradiolicum]CAB1369793.1 Pilus assembly protein PilO [Denitratisoma oestradiolicum]
MKKLSVPKISLPAVDFQQLIEDFKTLDPKDPGMWPMAPKVVILVVSFVVMLGLAWFLGWSSQLEELDVAQKKELTLKDDWLAKKKQAVNLDEYKKQLVEIDRSFGELLKQLPNKAEMDAMIIDISQSALTRGLKVELFKPGNEARKEFYAEMPITLQLNGSYNDLAYFAADIAKLPRIVTLNNVKLKPSADLKSGVIGMDAVAMTYRYLDTEEMAAQKKKQKGPAKKGGKK